MIDRLTEVREVRARRHRKKEPERANPIPPPEVWQAHECPPVDYKRPDKRAACLRLPFDPGKSALLSLAFS